MKIDLSLQDVRELNKIRGLLHSPDREARCLGLALLETMPCIKSVFYNTYYIPREGKQIPFEWYINKANKLKESGENFTGVLEPIVDAILLGEAKFVTYLYFSFDQYKELKNEERDNADAM